MTRRPYLVQRGGMACGLFALCNAARYLGYDTPEPGTPAWARLERRIDPPLYEWTRLYEVAGALGMHLRWLGPHQVLKKLPGLLIIDNPAPDSSTEGAGHTHAVALVGGDSEVAEIVSYHADSPTAVERIPWPSLAKDTDDGSHFMCWRVEVADKKLLKSWNIPLLERIVKRGRAIVG